LTDADYKLAEMFNHTKVSIDPRGHDSAVTYLIQNQYLADPRFVPISFDSDIAVMEPEPGVDYSRDDLDSLGRDDERKSKIVELAKNAAARHPRTIVFCPSVDSAVECNRLLRDEGVASQVITAGTHSDDRRAIIDAFRDDSREHMVMFN
jgi:superfamily II DNA or RNA helicase